MTRLARHGATLRVTGDGGAATITVCRPGIVRVALDGGGRPAGAGDASTGSA